MTKLTLSIGQHTDQGLKPENQDYYATVVPEDPLLTSKGFCAIIADGVSSCGQGKQASESCVKGFLSDYFSTPDSWTVKHSAHRVLMALNSWLFSQAQTPRQPDKGMLTTLSCLIIKSNTAHLFHVGDSRISRLQGDTLECMTNDHRVWVSADKNYLSRAMGFDIHLDVDYRSLPVEAGDIFILSTDGVHDFVSEKDIVATIHRHIRELPVAAAELCTQALANKSSDNVTCQIIRIDTLAIKEDKEIYADLTRLPFPPPLHKDMVLDGYKILGEIHSSKRTQVYKAEDTKTGKLVALKTPSPNFDDDAVYIEGFIHEEWVGKRLKNKNVITVIPRDRERQCLYYVTEYIDGQSLREWMKQHPQPEINEVRQIVKQIAAGLRAFHRLEMLHQDLKPENVMLDANGVVKLIDFGSTKIAGIAEISSPLERIALQGTKNYTAPEYLLGQPGSTRSDLFSLGIITYELLTGKLPYGELLDSANTLAKQAKLSYRPSHQFNPMIPIWLDRAIEMAVQPEPKRRYELLSEFVHDINKPNRRFMDERKPPLIERDPVRFWRGLAILSLFINLILLLVWLQ